MQLNATRVLNLPAFLRTTARSRHVILSHGLLSNENRADENSHVLHVPFNTQVRSHSRCLMIRDVNNTFSITLCRFC